MVRSRKKAKKTDTNGPSITNIVPKYVFSHIFSFCAPKNLCNLSSTCRLLRKYAREDIIKIQIEFGLILEKPIGGERNGRTRIITIVCPCCKVIFAKPRELKIHIRDSDKCSFPYECPRCSQSFLTKNIRDCHMKQKNHFWTHAEQIARQEKHHKEREIRRQIDAANYPKNPEISIDIMQQISKTRMHESKKVKVVRLESVTNVQQFLTKPCTLFNIKSTYIAPFLGACKAGSNLHLVYEFSESKSLHDYIKAKEPLTLEVIRMISTDVVRGMHCLYNQNPPETHGDLRTANIWISQIDKKRQAKVIGYGLNELYTKGVHNDALPYAAHEISKTGITEASDVYSFAMVMYAMLHSREPFEGLSADQISAILRDQHTPAISAKIPSALYSLITMCMALDPGLRPKFKQIMDTLLSSKTWSFK